MFRRTTLGLAALLLVGIGAFSPAANATPPTPISSCPFTITAAGNYVVTANLTATGTCITINASDVAIDLQGHMITGPGTAIGLPDGISSSGFQNIIIANGTIKGFFEGIGLENGTSYVTVSHINAMQNFDSGILLNSNSTVDNSQANNNGGGISFNGENNTVSNSQANNNLGTGISLDLGNSTVTNSQENNNGFTGIVSEGGNITVTNSPANNNGGEGMGFDGGGNTIINSPANGNAEFGIASNVGNNNVSDSQANGNGSGGISFGFGNNNISDSQANGNKGNGIEIAGDNNLLTSDTANGNVDFGIDFDAPSLPGCPSNLFGDTAQGNGTNTSSLTGCTLLDNNF